MSTLAELLRLQLSPGQPHSDPDNRPDPSLGPAAGRPRHRATAAHAQWRQPVPGGGREQPGALLQRGAWPAFEGSQPLRPARPRGQSGDGQQLYSGPSLQPAAGAKLALQDEPNSGFAFPAEEPSGVTRPSSFGASDQLSGGSWVSSPSDAPDPGTAVEWVDTIEPDFSHAIDNGVYTQNYFRPARNSEGMLADGFTAQGASLNIGAPFVSDTWEPDDDDDFMEDPRPRRGTIDAPRELVPSSLLAEPAARSRRRVGRQGAPQRRRLSSEEERMQSLLDTGNYAGL